MDKSSKIKGLIRSITGTDRPSFGFRLMEVVSVEGDLCRAKIDDFEIPDIRLSSINGGSRNGLLVKPAAGSIILVADLSCGNLRELCAVAYSEIESVRFHQGDTTITADGEKAEVVVGESSAIVKDADIKLCKGDSSVVVEREDITIKKGDNSSVVIKSDNITIEKGNNSVVVKSDGVVINGGTNKGLVKIENLRKSLESLKTYCEALKEATAKGLDKVGKGPNASGTLGAGAFNTEMEGVSITIDDKEGSMENPKVTH